MDTNSLRNMILTTPLLEEPVTVPGWLDPVTKQPAKLLIRELDGKSGAALIAACTDLDTQSVNQDKLVAGIILASLRNADDPNKALVFSSDPENEPDTYNPAFHDSLMATGLGRIMQVAQRSIKLSGLDASVEAIEAAKNASGATIVGASSTL